MQYVINGKLKDSSGTSPSRYLVEAYADVKLWKDPQLAKRRYTESRILASRSIYS